VVASSHFAVHNVACAGGGRDWSKPEAGRHLALVLPHRGFFRLRSPLGEMVIEPSTGYLRVPGGELAFAHPAGGDECTVVSAHEWLWPAEPVSGAAVRVSGAVELAHRRLALAAAADDQAFSVAESLVGLLSVALLGLPRPGLRGGTSPYAARLAADAAEAIAMADPVAAGLIPLARRLSVSPAHLSRTFRRATGVTLTRYRNRIRISRALDRLLQGEENLAALAAELGFADQAHLTRAVRAEVGHPPGALRHLRSLAEQ
jgi:AraC-like DNA-binding protein